MCMSQAPKPSKKDKMKAKKVAARANDPANHDAKHAYEEGAWRGERAPGRERGTGERRLARAQGQL